jgi:ATP-binding cassette subfamily B protein
MKHKPLSIARGTWSLIRFRPGFFLTALLFTTYALATRLVPGWLEKRFYDELTGEAPVAGALWGILGLIIAVEVSRMAANVIGEWAGMRLRNAGGSLMRKNIVQNILRKPGAEPLPLASGDVIGRMDNEIPDFADFPTWLPELAGHTLFALLAIVVMAQISGLITLVAVLPLAGLFFLNRFAWQRFLHYNRESRRTDSQVTSFLGEVSHRLPLDPEPAFYDRGGRVLPDLRPTLIRFGQGPRLYHTERLCSGSLWQQISDLARYRHIDRCVV